MKKKMWNKPWTMKEGFLIGAGLLVVGLLLQLSAGAVAWELFAWPVNIVVLVVLVVLLVTMSLLYNKVYAFRFLSTYAAAIPALAYAVVLTVVMGLTVQTEGGTWLNNMLRFWPFVLVWLWLVVCLSQVVLRRLRTPRWRDIPFYLNHLGLLLALVTATLGNPDMRRMKMICTYNNPEWRGIDENDMIVELPLAIELKRFIVEEYPDERMPKRFASDIQVLTRSGKNLSATVEVNKPAEVEGWSIYQYGYDQQMGPRSEYSIFELVTDPWLPAVYAGIFMMLAGAVCMIFSGKNVKTQKP